LAFLLSPAVILAISGRDSAFAVLAKDYYKVNINKYLKNYLKSIVAEVLDNSLHFIISEEVGGVSGWV
jgi:hypothetical protein